MYKISVRGHFSAAHFLEDYLGLCSSVHGHRWEVILSAELKKNAETSMLVDFSDLKSCLEELLSKMDHSFILDPNGNQVSKDFYSVAKKHNMRVFEFEGRVTAENISHFLWKEIQRLTGWNTHTVEVFEAPGNSVMYSEDK